jgi:hypothetical protein
LTLKEYGKDFKDVDDYLVSEEFEKMQPYREKGLSVNDAYFLAYKDTAITKAKQKAINQAESTVHMKNVSTPVKVDNDVQVSEDDVVMLMEFNGWDRKKARAEARNKVKSGW